jgi:hypothetical protein
VSLSWIAPAILAIAALVLVVNLSRSMPGRQNITFVNQTSATISVDATGNPPDGTVGVGTFDPKSRETAEAVIDQGDAWRFELTVGPDRIAEIRRTADQLRADHWTVTIPADAADVLEPSRRAGG